MRKFIFILLAVFFLVIYFYSTENENDNWLHQGVSQVKMTINSLKLSKNRDAKVEHPQKIADVEPSAGSLEVSFKKMDREQFQSWVQQESKLMNSTRNNTQEIQVRLKTQAQELGPQQFESLKDFALNTQLSINERILANYLLTLSDSPQALENAIEVAKSQIPDYGPSVPHSEAEIKNTQELALRYMQIDQLYELAKTDTNARDKLKLLVTEASSEQVRNYAKKKYFELK